jgi:hypothetical protein
VSQPEICEFLGRTAGVKKFERKRPVSPAYRRGLRVATVGIRQRRADPASAGQL